MTESRPNVQLRRRPGDFQRRASGTLLQMGTTCCTCCLIWVGTAIGGSAGLVHAWNTLGLSGGGVHRRRILIVYATLANALLAIEIVAASMNWGNSGISQALLGGLILVSPLNLLVLGVAGLLTAAWSSRKSPAEERGEIHRFACRLLWMSFNYACLGWVLCLGLMSIWDRMTPEGSLIAAVATAAAVIAFGVWRRGRLAATNPPLESPSSK